MLKNILAAIGLYFVAKKGYEHYQECSELKRKQEEREQGAQANGHNQQ